MKRKTAARSLKTARHPASHFNETEFLLLIVVVVILMLVVTNPMGMLTPLIGPHVLGLSSR